MVRASDCQCRSLNSPGFDSSNLRHSGISGAADEAVLNINTEKKNLKNPSVKYLMFMKLLSKRYSFRVWVRILCFLWQIFYTEINVFSVGDSIAKSNWVVWAGRGRGTSSGIWVNKKPSDTILYCTVYMYLYMLFSRQTGSGCGGGVPLKISIK